MHIRVAYKEIRMRTLARSGDLVLFPLHALPRVRLPNSEGVWVAFSVLPCWFTSFDAPSFDFVCVLLPFLMQTHFVQICTRCMKSQNPRRMCACAAFADNTRRHRHRPEFVKQFKKTAYLLYKQTSHAWSRVDSTKRSVEMAKKKKTPCLCLVASC